MHARSRPTAPAQCAALYMLSRISGQTIWLSGAMPADPPKPLTPPPPGTELRCSAMVAIVCDVQVN